MATEIEKKLFTVYDYHKMADAGILRHDDHVELIRGEVIRMSPIHPPHNGTIHRANRFDRTTKMELYAETGVPEYWISDIKKDCVVAFSDADGSTYRTVREFRRGEKLTPRLLPECSIPAEALLP